MSVLVVVGPRKSGKSTLSDHVAKREGKEVSRFDGASFVAIHSGGRQLVWERERLTTNDMERLEEIALEGGDLIVETMEIPEGDSWPHLTITYLRPSSLHLTPYGVPLTYEDRLMANYQGRRRPN